MSGAKFDSSAVLTVVGIVLLFATAIVVTLYGPLYVDSSWVSATSAYQVQMYEFADPNIYLSTTGAAEDEIQYVYHLQEGRSLLAFPESRSLHIVAPPELQEFVTPLGGDGPLKLTSRLLLLRFPQGEARAAADKLQQQLQSNWERDHPDWEEGAHLRPYYRIMELFDPGLTEAFALAETDGISELWVDSHFALLDDAKGHPHAGHGGTLYVANPVEYRVSKVRLGRVEGWQYDSDGERIETLEELKSSDLGFMSREELIRLGEHLFAIDGCWYCHTDQSRTLVQDSVLNGNENYPAPPSSANEYIYQNVTFPGTRRIGPDLSRVGVKRPSRDWHMSHFWSPKTESPGSIMPSMQHFFDEDPRGSPKNPFGVPNWRFEAIFQYLMTKGTRITPPTQAWWQGKDPVNTLEILDGGS